MTHFSTVFLTGASGYIAKHILVQLLNRGFHVIGSVRNLDKAKAVTAALVPHLLDAGNLDKRLKFVALDREQDAGWNTAMQGADALLHTASPFPLAQPKNPMEIIGPAAEGTNRALRAAQAAGIKRVILTSSMAAIANTGVAGRA